MEHYRHRRRNASARHRCGRSPGSVSNSIRAVRRRRHRSSIAALHGEPSPGVSASADPLLVRSIEALPGAVVRIEATGPSLIRSSVSRPERQPWVRFRRRPERHRRHEQPRGSRRRLDHGMGRRRADETDRRRPSAFPSVPTLRSSSSMGASGPAVSGLVLSDRSRQARRFMQPDSLLRGHQTQGDPPATWRAHWGATDAARLSVADTIELDANLPAGSSGGPVVTDEGQVVAMTYAGMTKATAFRHRRDLARPILRVLQGGRDVKSVGINALCAGPRSPAESGSSRSSPTPLPPSRDPAR